MSTYLSELLAVKHLSTISDCEILMSLLIIKSHRFLKNHNSEAFAKNRVLSLHLQVWPYVSLLEMNLRGGKAEVHGTKANLVQKHRRKIKNIFTRFNGHEVHLEGSF